MANIYYTPEEWLLTPVGEIDWSDGCYVFDITAVWRREDGHIVYAEDAGCSCPSPFEDTTVEDLVPATTAGFQAHLEKRAREACSDESEEHDRWAMQIANLMAKVAS